MQLNAIKILKKTKPNITRDELDDITNENPRAKGAIINSYKDKFSVVEKVSVNIEPIVKGKSKKEIKNMINELITAAINTTNKKLYDKLMDKALTMTAHNNILIVDYIVDVYDIDKSHEIRTQPIPSLSTYMLNNAEDKNKVARKIADIILKSEMYDKISSLKSLKQFELNQNTVAYIDKIIHIISQKS